jgi:hypothetical protein
MALLARLANWRVEKVSAEAEVEGEMHTINRILPLPVKESARTLVSLEFLKGIWVLDLSTNAEMHCPRLEREPLM